MWFLAAVIQNLPQFEKLEDPQPIVGAAAPTMSLTVLLLGVTVFFLLVAVTTMHWMQSRLAEYIKSTADLAIATSEELTLLARLYDDLQSKLKRVEGLDNDIGYPGPPPRVTTSAETFPDFPDIGCDKECGFESRGAGWQCVAGSACGKYLHPGDKHFNEVNSYYLTMRDIDKAAQPN